MKIQRYIRPESCAEELRCKSKNFIMDKSVAFPWLEIGPFVKCHSVCRFSSLQSAG